MPAGDGSPLGFPAWLLVPRLTFMVAGAAGLLDELRYQWRWCNGVAIVQAAGVGD